MRTKMLWMLGSVITLLCVFVFLSGNVKGDPDGWEDDERLTWTKDGDSTEPEISANGDYLHVVWNMKGAVGYKQSEDSGEN